MIYINGEILDSSVTVLNVSGIYDFPALKQDGIDWPNQNYIKFYDENVNWHFGNRKISVTCGIEASTYSAFSAKVGTIIEKLYYDDVAMLTIPTYTKRAFLVYLSDSSLFRPERYFTKGGASLFTLTFVEPQPYNAQGYFEFTTPTAVSIRAEWSGSTPTTASDQLRVVDIFFNGSKTTGNLNDSNLIVTDTVNGFQPFVITGDLDKIDTLTVSPTYNLKDECELMLRNLI